MKIVILDGNAINPGDVTWEPFEKLGHLTVYDRTTDDQITVRIGGSQIVLTNKVHLTEQIFAAAPDIKWVGILATGTEIVDLDAASARGITVCNVADYSTAAVAEMVFALILELSRRVGAHSDAVMRGEWTASRDFCFWKYPQNEIYGKTLGIIGLGAIGQRTAKIAQAFGMNVTAVSKSRRLPQTDTLKYAGLDELYRRADIISLHCPLNSQTRGMIDKHAIAKMKDGVIIINTARGALINEAALADALQNGKVAGAGCDVVSKEPIAADNPLLGAKNAIITPHIAWASRQSRQRLINMAADNLKAFLLGRVQGAVNMENNK
ncbi:MAG: D-2-hydroxyacid dehydrogenase [Christensenellales bacterium]